VGPPVVSGARCGGWDIVGSDAIVETNGLGIVVAMAGESATRSGFAAAAVLVVVLGSTSPARGATPDGRASARQHSSRAEELKKQGKLAEACAELQEAERLDSKLPTLLDLAECTESLGKLLEAQTQWALARDRAKHDEKPQSRSRAEARLAAVQKRVPHLTLQLTASVPAGAQVLIDDVALDSASLANAISMNPGDHTIRVTLSGHDDAKYNVKLAESDNQSLPVAVGPVSGSQPSPATAPATPALVPSLPPTSAPAPSPEPPATPAPTGWWTTPRKAGVIFGSLGLVAIGAGSALVATGDSGGHVDQLATLGGISLVTGGAMFISGLVLLASAPRDDVPQHARVLVTPTLAIAQNATLIGAAGRF
jgi:hypothetical protein